MFQNADQSMLLLLDVSIKAILLAGIAVLVLKLFRLRDPNVRHRVWSVVLAGMLLLPLLALALPTIPFSMPATWADAKFGDEKALSTSEAVPSVTTPTVASTEQADPDGMLSESNSPGILENSKSPIGQSDATIAATEQSHTPSDASVRDATAASASTWTVAQMLATVSAALLVGWGSVSLLFMLRLFVAPRTTC